MAHTVMVSMRAEFALHDKWQDVVPTTAPQSPCPLSDFKNLVFDKLAAVKFRTQFDGPDINVPWTRADCDILLFNNAGVEVTTDPLDLTTLDEPLHAFELFTKLPANVPLFRRILPGPEINPSVPAANQGQAFTKRSPVHLASIFSVVADGPGGADAPLEEAFPSVAVVGGKPVGFNGNKVVVNGKPVVHGASLQCQTASTERMQMDVERDQAEWTWCGADVALPDAPAGDPFGNLHSSNIYDSTKKVFLAGLPGRFDRSKSDVGVRDPLNPQNDKKLRRQEKTTQKNFLYFKLPGGTNLGPLGAAVIFDNMKAKEASPARGHWTLVPFPLVTPPPAVPASMGTWIEGPGHGELRRNPVAAVAPPGPEFEIVQVVGANNRQVVLPAVAAHFEFHSIVMKARGEIDGVDVDNDNDDDGLIAAFAEIYDLTGGDELDSAVAAAEQILHRSKWRIANLYTDDATIVLRALELEGGPAADNVVDRLKHALGEIGSLNVGGAPPPAAEKTLFIYGDEQWKDKKKKDKKKKEEKERAPGGVGGPVADTAAMATAPSEAARDSADVAAAAAASPVQAATTVVLDAPSDSDVLQKVLPTPRSARGKDPSHLSRSDTAVAWALMKWSADVFVYLGQVSNAIITNAIVENLRESKFTEAWGHLSSVHDKGEPSKFDPLRGTVVEGNNKSIEVALHGAFDGAAVRRLLVDDEAVHLMLAIVSLMIHHIDNTKEPQLSTLMVRAVGVSRIPWSPNRPAMLKHEVLDRSKGYTYFYVTDCATARVGMPTARKIYSALRFIQSQDYGTSHKFSCYFSSSDVSVEFRMLCESEWQWKASRAVGKDPLVGKYFDILTEETELPLKIKAKAGHGIFIFVTWNLKFFDEIRRDHLDKYVFEKHGINVDVDSSFAVPM
eukprot:m.72393 g.72393  ORF g.72393 m.72393 type:complete len:899 (-) comp18723_c0_seq1:333-3029(-)